MLNILINQLAPIFIVIGIGIVFGRALQPDIKTLSRAALYILSPCLVISILTNSTLSSGDLWQIVGFATSVIIFIGAVTFLVARLLRLSRTLTAALLLSVMFANTGNYGLSLNLFAFGETALAHGAVYYVTSTFLIFSLGIFIASSGQASLQEALKGLLRLPPTYALIVSSVLIGFDLDLPTVLQRPVDLLGQAAIPIMLILLGIQISKARIPKQFGWIGLATGLRLLLGPAIGFGLATLFNLTGAARQAGIIDTSLPTAVITTLLAIEYDTEPTLVTGTVVFSTLLSPITLTPLLAWLA